MSEESRFDFGAAVRREWWLVLIVVLIAIGVTYALTLGGAANYTGGATVKIDYWAVNEIPSLFYGDRMLGLTQSPEFFETLAEETGLSVEELRANMRVTAQGEFLDSLAVRYSADSEEDAEQAAGAIAKAIIVYAQEVAMVETDRRSAMIAVNEDAVERMEALLVEVRASGDSYQEADLISRIAALQQSIIEERSRLAAIDGAYTFDGVTTVGGQASSGLQADALAGALLAGLVAGLGLAALREWWLLRQHSKTA